MATRLRSGQSRRRLGPRLRASVGLSLVVLLVGWSAFWLVARMQAAHSLEAWLAAERADGRIWTCPNRRIDGYPLAIVVRCDAPSFAEANNAGFAGQVAALKATAQLYFPTSVAIDIQGPLTIRDAGIADNLMVNWTGARVTLRGVLPGALDRGHLDAQEVEIAAGPGRAPTRVAAATIGFTPATDDAAELTAEITGLQDPDANAVFGSADPVAIDVKTTISDLPRRGASLPTLLERWHAAGGTLDLTRFLFRKGSFEARGSGTVTIDAAHRPAGRLQTHFAGLEPLAARFGIPVVAVKMGGLLSSLLGSKPDTPPAPQTAAGGLDLPIVLRDGRLFIGPAKTGLVLPALY